MNIVKNGNTIVIVIDDETARHLGHRLNVSSAISFANYRDKKDISGSYPRHPLADNFIAALTKAGVKLD